jgi:hypothetical protein
MGGKTSTTTQQVTVPPEVLARYNAVNARAESVANRPFQIYSTDPSKFVAQLNQQQQMGIGNVNAAAGAYQPYLSGATGATMAGMASANPADLEISKYMNPFQQDVINATMARMRQEQEQAQSGALGTAISSGAFGGDRAGIAAANLAQQQGMATGATLAGLNAQNYQQALQTAQQQQGLGLGAEQANLARLLSGGQQLAGLGQMAQGLGLQGAEAQINAGTLGQQTEQAGLSALYNQFQQEQAYPFQVAQFLANIAASTGALSGSTTTTTQPGSFWSDRRLKHDIKRIGKTDDGLPIYSFKYKGDDSEQTHVGFMADEVEKVNPDAVNTEPSGYKSVDYDRATKAGGGGVAGPYGSNVGSQPGVGGYVPQAYLPVGELMIADSSGLSNARMSMAQQLEAAAKIGESIKSLDEDWQWAKDRWGNQKREGNLAGAEEARDVRYASGGVVGYASGGPAYLEGGLKPAQNPVEKEGYLSDTVKSQEEGKKNQIMQPGSAPGQQASGASQLGSLLGGAGAAMSGFAAIAPLLGISDRRMKHDIRRIGKTDDGMPIYKFKYKGDDREQTHIGFMADEVERKHPDAVMTGSDGMKRVDYGQADKFYQGGVVRHGYATDGTVEDERTAGERVSEFTYPARDLLTRRLPLGALALANRITAGAQNLAGVGLGAAGAPEAADYAFGAGSNTMERARELSRRADEPAQPYPQPRDLSAADMRALEQTPEEAAALEARRNMTMEPSRSEGVIPSEYGRLLMNPAGSLPVGVADPMRFAAGDARMGAEASPMRFAAGDARMGAEASPMRFASGDSRMGPGLAPASSIRPQARPEGLGAASTSISTASQPDVAATQPPAAPQQFGFTGVAGAGKGYTDVILPDGTVERREGARNWRNNNPGNIEFGDFAKANGAVGSDGRFAVFPTYEAGRAAKEALLFSTDGYAGKTIAGALERYAPRADNNNTDAYIATVASALGVDPNTPLAELSPAQRDAMLTAMERVEGGGPGGDGQFVSYSTTPGGLGGASLAPPADQRGLGAGILTSDKPYEDRTTLGKMFYNEDGTVNRNALLSLASGVGAMLSSPSQFFLPSVGLGLQGAASTYAGLEKQAADIALTREEARRTNIEADRGRIYEGQNGTMFINLGGGMPPIELWRYLENPAAYSTGDRQLDAQILRQAREMSQRETPASGVFSAPEVQTLLDRETANSERNPNSARAQSDAIESATNASAAVARSAIPSILTQADAVAALTSPDEEVRSGALGPLKQTAANYLNDLSQTISQMTGVQLPTITDPNGGDAAANAQIILKEAVASGMLNANGIQELQTIMGAQPNMALSAEANSALMAGLLVSGRTEMRRADFMRDYKQQPGNTYRTVIDAGQAFQEAYGNQILAEKAVLKELIHYGNQPMPPEWATILGDYRTPMEFLMTPGISPEDKNEFIMKLLPALGVNEMVISGLQGPEGVYIGNYFGG